MWVVAAVGFLMLLADPLINTCCAQLWQTRVPPDIQGRVFALTGMIAASSLPYGAFFCCFFVFVFCFIYLLLLLFLSFFLSFFFAFFRTC